MYGIYINMNLLETARRRWKERKERLTPDIIFFVVNTHPNETCAPKVAMLVKENLVGRGFATPIEIIKVPDEHEIKGEVFPWYEVVANKGYGVRDSLQEKVIADLIKNKKLNKRNVSIISFHNSEHPNPVPMPCAVGTWRHMIIETEAIYKDVKNPMKLELIEREKRRNVLNEKDDHRFRNIADIETTRDAGLFANDIINTVAEIILKVTSDDKIFWNLRAKL